MGWLEHSAPSFVGKAPWETDLPGVFGHETWWVSSLYCAASAVFVAAVTDCVGGRPHHHADGEVMKTVLSLGEVR